MATTQSHHWGGHHINHEYHLDSEAGGLVATTVTPHDGITKTELSKVTDLDGKYTAIVNDLLAIRHGIDDGSVPSYFMGSKESSRRLELLAGVGLGDHEIVHIDTTIDLQHPLAKKLTADMDALGMPVMQDLRSDAFRAARKIGIGAAIGIGAVAAGVYALTRNN